MSLLNWKYWLAFVVIVALACIGGYTFGHTKGDATGYLRGHNELETYQSQQEAKNTAAINDARAAQHAADQQQIDDAKALAQTQAKAAATAAGAKAAADARATTLNQQLAELRKNDTAIAAQTDACLPPALLVSLHGDAAKDAALHCTAANRSH